MRSLLALDSVEPVLRSAGYWEDLLRATAWLGNGLLGGAGCRFSAIVQGLHDRRRCVAGFIVHSFWAAARASSFVAGVWLGGERIGAAAQTARRHDGWATVAAIVPHICRTLHMGRAHPRTVSHSPRAGRFRAAIGYCLYRSARRHAVFDRWRYGMDYRDARELEHLENPERILIGRAPAHYPRPRRRIVACANAAPRAVPAEPATTGRRASASSADAGQRAAVPPRSRPAASPCRDGG